MRDGKFRVSVARKGLALSAVMAFAGSAFAARLDEKPVTFAKDIAPIFQAKCEECHRKDSMAPMSLVTYEETRPWAKSINERVHHAPDAALAPGQDRRHPAFCQRPVA